MNPSTSAPPVRRRPVASMRALRPGRQRTAIDRDRAGATATVERSTRPTLGNDDRTPEDHPAAPHGVASAWTCTWVTGPDTGGRVVLEAIPDPTTSADPPATRDASSTTTTRPTPTRCPIIRAAAIVGRAPGATIRCEDPALEPHHVLLTAGPDGLQVLQLAGRMPLRVGGRPVETPLLLTAGATLELGHSTLRIVPGRAAPESSAHVRDGALLREPRVVPVWAPAALRPPSVAGLHRQLPGGLLPALLAIVASGVLATIMRQPMFLLFGAVGGVVALGSWLPQRIGIARGSRRARRTLHADIAAFDAELAAMRSALTAHLETVTSTTASAREAAVGRDQRLWARRADHADAFTVSLGTGDVVWHPPLAERPATDAGDERGTIGAIGAIGTISDAGAGVLHDVPVAVGLGPASRIAFVGEPHATAAVARALVIQLAVNCGPADLRVLVVARDRGAWQWVSRLPHSVAADGTPSVVGPADLAAALAAADQPGAPHTLVITDAPDLLASRTGALRRAITADRAPALISLVPTGAGVPHVCDGVLSIVDSPRAASPTPARWVADAAADELPVGVRIAGLGVAAASAIAGALVGLSDPDDPLAAATGIPSDVSLLDLLATEAGAPISAAMIAARWLGGGRDPSPRTPIGAAADGSIDIDLVRDGPHGLLAGTTGSGKSELLRTLVAGMAASTGPDHLTFVLVDYKGGATFDACAALPHVVGVVTDLDEQLADRALRSLDAELRRREALLRTHGAADLADLHGRRTNTVIARLVVVIDEFAALVAEQPDFLHALLGVAQRGRSLGVHLLLATQRPNGVISDDIRANTNIRLALRLQDVADALDVVGNTAPATLPRRLAGRAVLRLGPDEHVTFQTARCTGTTPSELDAIVNATREAMAIVGIEPPPGPWRPPLPEQLEPDSIAVLTTASDRDADALSGGGSPDPVPIGLIDDPDHQRVLSLAWHPRSGHLLLAGSPGSGVTSTLATLGWATLDHESAHLYVIDAHGDDALAVLAEHPRCAAVVRLHERERLLRLLVGLASIVDDRAAGSRRVTNPDVVLLVDGFADLRADLDDLDHAAELEAIERIITGGAAVGVSAVLAVQQPAAISSAVLARCPRRWLFHLADRHDAAAWGCAARDVPGDTPGRAAIGGGLHAQLVRPRPPSRLHLASSQPRHADDPLPIEVLSSRLAVTDLGPARASRGVTALPIGAMFTTGATATIDVPDGEHVMILGPARSGRSTALARVVSAWRECHPGGWAVVVAPRWRAAGQRDLDPAGHLRVPTGRQPPDAAGRQPADQAARNSPDPAARQPPDPATDPAARVPPDPAADSAARQPPDPADRAAHHPLDQLHAAGEHIGAELGPVLAALPPTGAVLLAVDDADVVDDPHGAIAALIAARRGDLLVVATGKPEVLRQSYGHWTAVLRRSRLGIVLAAANELDGDLIGAPLPRRRPVAARPGLAWLADNGDVRLVQIAIDTDQVEHPP